MHATVRRYEGVDASRTGELKTKVNETLIPQLNKIDGFKGYYLLEAGNGVMSSFSLFDNSAHADEATKPRGRVERPRCPLCREEVRRRASSLLPLSRSTPRACWPRPA